MTLLPRAQWKLPRKERTIKHQPIGRMSRLLFDCNQKSKTKAGMSLINEPTIPNGNRFVAGLSPLRKFQKFRLIKNFEKLLDICNMPEYSYACDTIINGLYFATCQNTRVEEVSVAAR